MDSDHAIVSDDDGHHIIAPSSEVGSNKGTVFSASTHISTDGCTDFAQYFQK